MSTRTLPRGSRRWLSAGALVALLVTTATACYGSWGVRTSFRSYVNQPFADGQITTGDGATWLDGPGLAKGPFQWQVQNADLDPATETGWIQFSGRVAFEAHPYQNDHLLDLEIWNPRLELDGDEGTLVADLNYRPYVGISPATLPELEGVVDIPFADVDLSGFDWTLADGTYTITDAPMTGIPAAMTAIGWDLFYPSENPVQLDPISVSFDAELFAPGFVEAPRLTVSKTSDLDEGDEIIVWGAGYAPNSTLGTRPPLTGQPSGTYVVLGKFADVWKPTANAPSSARTGIDTKWAVPEPSYSVIAAQPGAIRTDAWGNFNVVLDLSTLREDITGNYGVYGYPGGGAKVAAYELAVPLQVNLPAVP
jgi:hypothetical protein